MFPQMLSLFNRKRELPPRRYAVGRRRGFLRPAAGQETLAGLSFAQDDSLGAAIQG
jgi:hypothetical protein